jgi:hypothetical protein
MIEGIDREILGEKSHFWFAGNKIEMTKLEIGHPPDNWVPDYKLTTQDRMFLRSVGIAP